MSLEVNRGRLRRPRPASRAADLPARSLIEKLEPRQLLSFQGSGEMSHAFGVGHEAANAFPVFEAALEAHANFEAAAISQATGVQLATALHGESGCEGSTTAVANATPASIMVATTAPASTTAIVPSEGAPVGLTWVTRLASGSAFSGYQYIPPNGSTPPALNSAPDPGNPENFEFPPGGTVIVSTPQKLKPSDRVDSVAAQSSPTLTPLAQTPGAAPASVLMNGRAGIAVPAPVTVPPSLAASGTSLPSALPHVPIYLAPLAVINSSEVVLATGSATVAKAADELAYASNKAADALSLLASPQGLGDVASYNFVHFNPSVLLNDAIAAFSQESASLSFVPAPTRSTARAWTITIAVVGFDLLLMGYCYHKSRREKAIAAKVLAASGGKSA